MRRIKHWTPTYVLNRLAVKNFRRKYENDLPSLTVGATQFLETYLSQQDTVFEFGSGFSTAWFAQRVGKIISVESDPHWYNLVKGKISGLSNAELFLIDSKENCTPIASVSWDYVRKIENYDKQSFNFILNDGYARPLVALQSIDYLKNGGVLCWDDFGGSFPLKNSTIPGVIKSDRDAHDLTKQFMRSVETWRRAIFDDGCQSTAFFFKPHS